MSSSALVFPEDFDDYGWEVEAKGWFEGAILSASGKRYRLHFFGPGRLRQEIEDELRERGVFFEPNLVVVSSVTRANMERAAEFLTQSGQIDSLIAE